jgi:hypothetical protein
MALTTDQRGFHRPCGGANDIGAFEAPFFTFSIAASAKTPTQGQGGSFHADFNAGGDAILIGLLLPAV